MFHLFYALLLGVLTIILFVHKRRKSWHETGPMTELQLNVFSQVWFVLNVQVTTKKRKTNRILGIIGLLLHEPLKKSLKFSTLGIFLFQLSYRFCISKVYSMFRSVPINSTVAYPQLYICRFASQCRPLSFAFCILQLFVLISRFFPPRVLF